jgi:hypothetical protein
MRLRAYGQSTCRPSGPDAPAHPRYTPGSRWQRRLAAVLCQSRGETPLPLFAANVRQVLKVAAASRRCSLSEQRRDASATFRRQCPAGFGGGSGVSPLFFVRAEARRLCHFSGRFWSARAPAPLFRLAPPFWLESGLILTPMTLIRSRFAKVGDAELK